MKLNLKPVMNATVGFTKRHLPEILTGIGIGGFFTAIGLAITATPDASRAINMAEKEKGKPLSKMEIVKVTWKFYVPTAAMSACATACMIGSNVVDNKRIAALAALYQLTEDNLKDLRDHATEMLGRPKETALVTETATKKISDINLENQPLATTKYGDVIFYDPWSARFFGCNQDRVEKAKNAINLRLTGVDFVTLNEFYDELDLPNTQFGNYMGFTSRMGEHMEIAYGYGPTGDGRSCTVLDFDVFPGDVYRKLSGCSCVQ